MNQLELFVASSESARSDAWRYLRRMRELDSRIEEDMNRLREIAQLLTSSTSRHEVKESDKDHPKPLRKNAKRGRPPLSKHRDPPKVDVVNLTVDENSISSDTSVISIEPHRAQMLVEYRLCRRRVLRQALEREKVAEELKSCGAEMSECLAARMEQFSETLQKTGGLPTDASS
ncbi:uncharacterized protein TM35_000112550 [Trypanosoma theileri]|uniref:Uncharacterized protein n=1 Tax=Trypanosoma theileri TaxID=67003 RepID=A0A1X0NYP6_9TRYP|nr:uncharacterized protein TM35_000112550 [Trypanosoma theileri]ORC89721.1 hypothetical protein TM35_000112550 [Trypanosoma theileri]